MLASGVAHVASRQLGHAMHMFLYALTVKTIDFDTDFKFTWYMTKFQVFNQAKQGYATFDFNISTSIVHYCIFL